jgi:hypothetical protein
MALSNAERQRRYIARLKEKVAVTNDGVTNEFVRLKAFAGQLEHENATLKEKLAAVTNEVTRLKASVDKLNLENKALQLRAPKGSMTATQFNAILKCLHPDMVHRLHDEGVTKRYNEAFKIFNDLRPRLVKA